MTPVRLLLNIDPVAKGRPRMTRRGNVYTPTKTKTFEKTLKSALSRKYSGAPIDEALFVSISFNIQKPKSVTRNHPSVKSDIDNYAKAVLDAGNGILWKDDAIICELNIEKRYAETGSIEIYLSPIDGGGEDDAFDP